MSTAMVNIMSCDEELSALALTLSSALTQVLFYVFLSVVQYLLQRSTIAANSGTQGPVDYRYWSYNI